MKAPGFWYRPSGAAAALLAPASTLYRAGARLRRVGAEPYRPDVPAICVGNVVAGGSGKTPTALAIAAYLVEQGQRPVFVTRGYGGREAGPLRVDPARHRAADVGDEPLLLARVAPTWIGRDRAAAMREAAKDATHIVLDDGLQNPHIAPHLSLLVIDAAAGLGNGRVIPAGPLREPFADALRRAKIAVVIGGGLQAALEAQIPAAGATMFTAHLQPELSADFPRIEKFLAFAGIGRPQKFYDLCRAAGLSLAATRDFPDHHVFSAREIEALRREAAALVAGLLTTEKDLVRLPSESRAGILSLPVRLVFDDADALHKIVLTACSV